MFINLIWNGQTLNPKIIYANFGRKRYKGNLVEYGRYCYYQMEETTNEKLFQGIISPLNGKYNLNKLH